MKQYVFKLTIDDSMVAYEYQIPCDGSKSIQNVAELVRDYLESDVPLVGKMVEGSLSPILKAWTLGKV